ncbi:MAG TPA: CDP-alcohol phosphatidyltransferase family protein [Thermomicrobiales bacterium]|nr:CDP-alcohol phosphatidyltransferase family protein [Thermomicrobiales bacterium]
MTFRQSLPALVTMVTLTCGLAALEATRVGAWELALRLILLGMVADGVDGPLARRLRATTPMGQQLDSLADVVAFGAAPAFLFSTYYGGAPDPVRFGVALAFVLAGAYRLARFHAGPTEEVFRGLPITAAGPLLAVTVAGPFGAGAREAGGVGIGLAALMVCHHPFPTLALSRRWLLPAIAAASLPVALWPRVETLAVVTALILGAYVVWGVGRGLANRDGDNDVRGFDEEGRKVVGPRP